MILPRSRFVVLLAAATAAILCTLYVVGFAVAHADPVGASTAVASPPTWSVGEVMALLALVIAGVGAVVDAARAVLHFTAPRTTSTLDDRAAARLDELHNRIAQLEAIVPAPTVAASAPKPTASTPVATLLALVLIGMVALQPACGAQPRVVAGVTAGLDCEQPNLQAIVTDGLALATAALISTISGSGHPDKAAIKAAFGATKSDGMRCLTAAAFAALMTPQPAKPTQAAAAGLEVNAGELRAAFAQVRAGWGLSSVHVAGQVL